MPPPPLTFDNDIDDTRYIDAGSVYVSVIMPPPPSYLWQWHWCHMTHGYWLCLNWCPYHHHHHLPLTMTLMTHDTLLLALSMAVYVTRVRPSWKSSPCLCVLWMVRGSWELSENRGSSQSTYTGFPWWWVMINGGGDTHRSMRGGCVSEIGHNLIHSQVCLITDRIGAQFSEKGRLHWKHRCP